MASYVVTDLADILISIRAWEEQSQVQLAADNFAAQLGQAQDVAADITEKAGAVFAGVLGRAGGSLGGGVVSVTRNDDNTVTITTSD